MTQAQLDRAVARVTGEKKYLDLSKYFIDERGTEPHFFTEEAIRDGRDASDFHQKTYQYGQAHLPVREQRKVVGHAVRAMYLYAGMADIASGPRTLLHGDIHVGNTYELPDGRVGSALAEPRSR